MKKNYHLNCAGRNVSVCVAAILLSIFLFGHSRLKAQALTGTVTVPGTYSDLATAINALNANGVGAGGVTISVLAGNPQSAPAGGYQINPNGTSANPIIINGNGNTVTASNALTAGALNDAIFKLVGADYTTITSFNMQENAANTTTAAASNNMTEWGIALTYSATTDGATNNTITTNTITLSRSYTNTFGIYSNVRHSLAAPTTTADITAASGANSNNKVYSNNISNVNMGIAFIGSGTAANQDQGNDIGGSSIATGNTITNWGGAAAASGYPSNSGTSYGIFVNHQRGENVSYNTLTSASVSGTSVTFRGIFKDYTTAAPTGTFLSSIANNTVTLTSGFTSGTFECIRSQGMTSLSTATITISNNSILNSVISGASSSSAMVCIINSSVPGVLNLTNNIIKGNTSTATSGGFTGISNSGAVSGQVNITNNQIGNASGNAITFSAGTSGAVSCIANSGSSSTGTVTISGNNIQGIVHSIAGSSAHTYINTTAADASVVVSNNTFTNLNVNTTGSVTFISHNYAIPATGSLVISSNSIVTAFNKGGAGGTVNLTASNSTSGTGSVNNYLNNNFSNITVTGGTTLNGFNNTDGGTGSTKTITGNTFNQWTGGTSAINTMNFTYWNGVSSLSNNIISNITGQAGITGITLGSSANNATSITVSSNTITSMSSTGTGGTVLGISSSNTSPVITFTNNTISSISSTGSVVTVAGIQITGGSNVTIGSNTVSTASGSGATASVIGVNVAGGSTVTVNNNSISNLTGTNFSAHGIMVQGGTNVSATNNLINTISGNATLNGVFISGGTNVNATSNIINTIAGAATTGSPSANGINVSGGTTVTLMKNKIYDISQSGALVSAVPGVNGILMSGGTTLNVYNNLIGDLRAPASAQTDAIRGISIISAVASTTYNIYYNTVSMKASSSGANFGTSALYHAASATATTANLDLRNNILINNSTPNGTGLTVAYRISNTSLANYASTSNNNLYYAGTPSASNLIFYDGTNSNQTLAAFQAQVGPTRDNASVTEDVTFQNVASSSPLYLHINTSVPTLAESGAANISGITTDYDGDIRQGNAGYTGTGSAPDIGADEFSGTNPNACTGTPTPGTVSGPASAVCGLTASTLTLTGASSGVGYLYQWQSSATPGGPYTNFGSGNLTQTVSPNATTYYVVNVTCTGSGNSAPTAEFTLSVNPAPVVAVTPASSVYCVPGSGVQLTASGATTYSWSPATGLSSSTAATVTATPAAATVYTVTGTDGAGCSATASTSISVAENPSVLGISATPPAVCSGASSQLAYTVATTTAYTESAATFAPINSGTGTTVLASAGTAVTTLSGGTSIDDGYWNGIALPFTFTYFGASYNSINVQTNGAVSLSPFTTATGYNVTMPNAAAPNNLIAACFGDLDWRFGGVISCYTSGTAPNRVFVINFDGSTGGGFYNSNAAPTVLVVTQVQLFEGTNIIQIHSTNIASGTSINHAQGIENASGSAGVVVPGRNNSTTWSLTNDAVQFVPSGGTFTYTWTPSAFLNNTTIFNPLASNVTASNIYTVVATSSAGCVNSGTVALAAGSPLTSSVSVTPDSTVCANTTFTLNSIPSGGGAPYTYAWSGPNSFTATTQNPSLTASAAAAGVYTITVTDNCGATSVKTVSLTVNPAPSLSVTPASTLICNPGGTAVSLDASGANTYTWVPSTGLSASNVASVTANPSVTTIYTVTGTDAIGCSTSLTASVTVSSAVAIASISANPAAVCSGSGSTLTVSGYPVSNAYCASTHSSGCASNDEIQQVILNTLNNTSGCATGAYTYFNAGGTQTTTLTAGSTYTLSIKFGTDASQYSGAWIDYNQDGTLAAGEFLGATPNAGSGGTATLTFTVPAGAYNGLTRLRIVGGNDNAVTSAQACGASSSNYGETEDYNVMIAGGAANTALTYSWSPGTFLASTNGSTVTASSVTATVNYTATVTSPAGCSVSDTVTLVAGSPLTSNASISPSATVCAGTTFTLVSTPAGGGAPYTFAWSGPNSFTATAQDPTIVASVASAGDYTVIVTDNCGATSTNVVTLAVNPQPSLTLTPTSGLICNPGGSAVDLSASGANTYTWVPAAGLSATNVASVSATPTVTTVYTVTGTDAIGCSTSASATITVAPTLSMTSITASPANICSGGSSTLTAVASPNNTYCASTHSSGCSFGDEIQQITLNTLSNISTCGTGAYTFYSGGGTQTTSLTAGNTYTLSAKFGTDGNQYFGAWIDFNQDGTLAASEFLGASANAGSGGTTSITFTVPAGAVDGITRLRVVGGNDNAVTSSQACGASSSNYGETEDYNITITGGAPGTTFSWSPSTFLGSTNTASVIASGVTATTTYTAIATSAAGCSVSGTVTLSADPLSAVNLSVSPSATVCVGTPLTISSTVIGGGSPYSYTWSPGGQSTANITVTPTVSTTYTLDVMDNCGATTSNTIAITVNPLPVVNVTPTATLYCIPGTSPTLTATGANTYSWTPANGLSATSGSVVAASPTVTTSYIVTGTDVNGCVNTASVSITSAPAVTGYSASVSATPICAGDTIDLSASANTYSVTLFSEDFNTGAPSWIRTNNSAGGTVANAAWTNRPDGYVYSGTTYHSNDNSQFVQSNSDAQGSGSTTKTTLQSPAFSTVGLSNLNLKFYQYFRALGGDSAIVEASTDASSWTTINSYTATVGGAATFSATSVALPSSFDNQSTVYVRFRYYATWDWYWSIDNVSVTGSSSGYTYNWSSAPAGFTSTQQNPSNLVPAANTTYSVDITNIYGCSATAVTSVTVNPLPVVNLGNDTSMCGGTLTLNAGNPGSTYLWNDASTAQTLVAGSTGTYYVAVTTAQGCTATDTIHVVINPAVVLNLGPDTTHCGGTVVLNAGNPGATYLWSTSATTQTIAVTTSGIYNVTVTNAQGCSKSDTVQVTINPVPVVNLGNDTMVCGGSVVLNAGNAGATYLWSDASVAQTLTVTSTGTYFVDVTNVQGCTTRDTVNITLNPAVVVNLGNDTTICAGNSVILDAQNPGATYLWNDNSTGSVLVVNTPGTYYVTVSYTTGCSSSDTITLNNGTPSVTLTLPTHSVCVNATPVALSGGSPASGIYSGAGVSGSSFDPSVAGTGTATITYSYTDATTGCSNSATDAIVVSAAPSVTLTLPIDSICMNASPISLTGGSPANGSYSGSGVSGGNFDPAAAGLGTVVITYSYTSSATGCSGSATDNIVVKSCVDIKQYNAADLVQVYPNPTTGSFTIQLGSATDEVKATLYSVEGKLIFSSDLSGKTHFEYDIDKLEDGMYYLELRSAQGSKVVKLVKQF